MKKMSIFVVSVAFLLFTGVLSKYLDLTLLWAAPESDQQEGVAEEGVSVECLQGFLSDIQGCLQLPAAEQLSCVLNSVQILLACLSGPAECVDEVWMPLEDIVRQDTTSTSSILLPNGMIRTYFLDIQTPGAFVFAESADGLDLSLTVVSNVQATFVEGDPENFVSNPAVLLREDGTYLLVYEASSSTAEVRDRLLYARTSPDGITFGPPTVLPSSDLDLGPEGNLFQSVPDLVRLPDGSIRLYYVANGTAIASMRSTDDGATWTQEEGYRLGGLRPRVTAAYVDPDVVVNEDGTFKMYLAYSEFEPECGGLGCQRIRVACSQDGLIFTLDEEDLLTASPGKLGLVDPDVYRTVDDTWYMLYGRVGDGGIDLWAAHKSS